PAPPPGASRHLGGGGDRLAGHGPRRPRTGRDRTNRRRRATGATKETLTKPLSPIRLTVIVANVRPGRFAPVVANWFLKQVEQHPVKVDLIDLAKAGPPPVIRAEAGPEVAQFAGRAAAAEAFTIVTCEYSHGYPASLKQAMDLLREEW